jgi:hypothetical protein
MMQNPSDPIVAQDPASDDEGLSNLDAPMSQAEITELMFSEALPKSERLEQLRTIRDQLRRREAADVGEDDPRSLLDSIDVAIATLEMSAEGIDPLRDPNDHIETLSPDDDLLLADDDDDEEDTIDDEEAAVVSDWDPENDGHDGRHGFHRI